LAEKRPENTARGGWTVFIQRVNFDYNQGRKSKPSGSETWLNRESHQSCRKR
jgi:hypothetical protein